MFKFWSGSLCNLSGMSYKTPCWRGRNVGHRKIRNLMLVRTFPLQCFSNILRRFVWLAAKGYQLVTHCVKAYWKVYWLLFFEIQVWVLTGDKEETAVNISHSCGHFKVTMITRRFHFSILLHIYWRSCKTGPFATQMAHLYSLDGQRRWIILDSGDIYLQASQLQRTKSTIHLLETNRNLRYLVSFNRKKKVMACKFNC